MSQRLNNQTADKVFSLGRISWQERRYSEAIRYFGEVVKYSERADLHQQISELTGGSYNIEQLASGRELVLSPDGKYLAYISRESGEWGVYIYDIKNAKPRRLANRVSKDTTPLFSPDGLYLAFLAKDNNYYKVYLATKEEREARCIVSVEGKQANLAISPEGRRLSFAIKRLSDAKQVISIVDLLKPEVFQLEIDEKWNFPPKFFPDGNKLISMVSRSIEDKKRAFFVVYDIVSGKFSYFDVGVQIHRPYTFSPDGKCIVFGNKQGLCNFSLEDVKSVYLYRSEGGKGAWSPAFSKDGKNLLFISVEADESIVYLLNLNTMKREVIFKSNSRIAYTEFLSDSRKILCGQRTLADGFRLFLVGVDSRQPTMLLPPVSCGVRLMNSQKDISPSPDGKKIFYVLGFDKDSRVCCTDLENKTINQGDLSVRLDNLLSQEIVAVKRKEMIFKPIDSFLRSLTTQVSQDNLEKDIRILQDIGPRSSGSEGCRRAGEFIYERLSRFGLETRYDDYEHPKNKELNSRNVIAVLPGEVNLKVTYVICAHYDTVKDSPGAWDNASGVAVVLETARILAKLRFGATINFVCFSGEEINRVGSMHFAQGAKSGGLDLRSVLTNDCIGCPISKNKEISLFYTSPILRNLLHSAAAAYTDLLTYSSGSPENSDGRSFVKVFGKITTLIQDYPFMPNWRCHGPRDTMEIISLPKITEVVKLNISALSIMAMYPAPVRDIKIERTGQNGKLRICWQHNIESDVKGYRIYYGCYPNIFENMLDVGYCNDYVLEIPLPELSSTISIQAYNERGCESWGSREIDINQRLSE